MSPEMLTLVAAVLAVERAYDTAREMAPGAPFVRGELLSRKAISDTIVENDMVPDLV